MKTMKRSFERGQALILIALAAIGLFGIAGLAIDGSAKFSDRRHAQNAADTAVLAGALARVNAQTLAETDPITWTPQAIKDAMVTAAKNRATVNGYDGNLVSNQVWVYSCDAIDATSPVDCGPAYNGNSDYIQVAIRSYVNTSFARVIGIKQTKNVVSAVVLTKKGGPLLNGASIVALNPSPNCSGGGGSGGGSFDVGGSGTINLNGGGIFVNSSASCGYSQTSCNVTLNITGGAGITSAGSDINQSCGIAAHEDQSGTQVVVPDEIYMPKRPAECDQAHPLPTNDPVGSKTWTIYPGYYTDFPQGGLIAANKNIYLSPGVYCVDSDLHWSGSTFDLLDGKTNGGVTIYITAGHSFSFNINSPIKLDPSASGEYKGYLIILDGNMNNIQNCTINGGSYLDMNGTIFAPYCHVTINGDNTSQSTFNAQIIGWEVKLNGNNVINFNYNPSNIPQVKRRLGLMR